MIAKRKLPPFQRTKIPPADFISGANTLVPTPYVLTCNNLTGDWIPSQTYIEWGKRGLAQDDEFGFGVAMTYSKAAVCRMIDAMLWGNHLRYVLRHTYPAKIAMLRKLGVNVPDLVHELIINERNDLEHTYKRGDKKSSKRALELAQLAVDRIRDEKGGVIAFNWRLNTWWFEPPTKFPGFGDENTILFVDAFGENCSANLIEPAAREIRYAELSEFADAQAMEFATLLRSPSGKAKRHSMMTSGLRREQWVDLKKLGGL